MALTSSLFFLSAVGLFVVSVFSLTVDAFPCNGDEDSFSEFNRIVINIQKSIKIVSEKH